MYYGLKITFSPWNGFGKIVVLLAEVSPNWWKGKKGWSSMSSRMMSKLAVLSLAAFALSGGFGVTLEVTRVSQRYPWNGLVDIDYTVTLAPNETERSPMNGDSVEFFLKDRSANPESVRRLLTFAQGPSLPMSSGHYRVTWDAAADGVKGRFDNSAFSARLVHHPAVYMVVDVTEGTSAEYYPVTYFDGAPSDGFTNDVYKTSKIVLRRMFPDGYVAGSPTVEKGRQDGEAQHRVILTNAFYIGIYEITQQQYLKVMGENESRAQVDLRRPVEYVSYTSVRGGSWPETDSPAPDSFMDRLRQKCKSADESGAYTVPVTGFDLPTEFQWEYACRGGTTTPFNNGVDCATDQDEQTRQLDKLGRNKHNRSDDKGGFSTAHTVVGLYEPNAWGLYDMHGNVWEWCRDFYLDDVAGLRQVVEPVGAPSGTKRVVRGAGWDDGVVSGRSARRNGIAESTRANDVGFRLICTER